MFHSNTKKADFAGIFSGDISTMGQNYLIAAVISLIPTTLMTSKLFSREELFFSESNFGAPYACATSDYFYVAIPFFGRLDIGPFFLKIFQCLRFFASIKHVMQRQIRTFPE